MEKRARKSGLGKLVLTYVFVLVIIVVIEAFASFNIHLLEGSPAGVPILRDVFSAIAIFVTVFTIIANIVFLGGRKGEDRKFHYYFRTRPLLLYSATAVIGDIIAVFLVGRAGFAYIVFFTSLIALNLFAIGFAIYCVEKTIRRNKCSFSPLRFDY